MLVLGIPDIKGFMAKFLREAVFDSFELRSIVIETFGRFEIDGEKPGEDEAQAEYSPWGIFRQYAYDIIRGGDAPRAIKAVLALNTPRTKTSFPNSAALFMNIRYEPGKITITSGHAQKTFAPDCPDKDKWDKALMAFLQKNNIEYTNELDN